MKRRGAKSQGNKPRGRRGLTSAEGPPQPQREKSSVAGKRSKKSAARFPIVGVGASAGGLEAFTRLLQHLPTDTGMGFVLVQHLDPDHESALTQLLTRATKMPVREVSNNLRVEPNRVYVIPPNTSLVIAHGVLKLQRRAGRAPHRSVDSFFESLAHDQRECAIGIILSGTASDGTLGLEAIKAEGGITFAQDSSARYDSMPRNAIAAGCVDLELSPENIAKELARIAKHPYLRDSTGQPLTPLTSVAKEEREPSTGRRSRARPDSGENPLKKILLLLRNHTGVDFSLYKPSTIQRRSTRRMVLNRVEGPAGYARFLQDHPKELDALYSDLLINVTSFFRNPAAFEVLKQKVFRKLIEQRRDKPLRAWVVGCSTGQEAYSIAMSYLEFAEHIGNQRKLQIFATDVNEALLEKARIGLFPKNLVQNLSPERLRRFFVEEDGGYRVAKFVREIIVFARQNLLGDPPFSRMDLISCRNLMIYLEADLQRKLLPTLHYALKSDGFLFLGESESIGPHADLFETVDKKHKVFSKRPGVVAHVHFIARHPAEKKQIPTPKPPTATEPFPTQLSTQREADRLTLNRYAPPGVLINSQMQILQFRGDTSAYLKPPTGTPSVHLLKMAREGLMLPLRASVKQAKTEDKVVRREGVRISQNTGTRVVNFEVVPLTHLKENCCLIFFEDAEETPHHGSPPSDGKGKNVGGRRRGRNAAALPVADESDGPSSAQRERARMGAESRVAELERELSETRDYLQSIQEQYEASNEELQASNEEVTSANEELQSINEELETSKEELESTNEELTTVNDEMANRNAELNRLNSDLSNLHASLHTAIVLLNRELKVRSFTPVAEKLFNLAATDVGRPLSHIQHNLNFPRLEQFLSEVLDTVSVRELEVQDKQGRWYSLRGRPYKTLDSKIDGVVLMAVDIDALKRSKQKVAVARDYAEAILRTTRYPLVVLTSELRIHTANASFYKTFKVSPDQTEGHLIYELSNGQWNIPKLRQLLEGVLARKSSFVDFEVTHEFENLGRRTMLLNARRLETTEKNAPERILLAIDDVTEGKQWEAVRESEARYRLLFESAKDGVLIVDPSTQTITDSNPCLTQLTGYSREELLGKRLCDIGLFETPAACEAAFRRLCEKGIYRDDNLPGRTKAGERRQLEMVSNLYEEEGRQVVQCNIRDITERKQAETSLRDARDRLADQAGELERLVAERTTALRETVGELESFSYSIAHDLRAPLRAIQSFALILEERCGEQINSQAKDYIRRITTAAERMDHLIQDVLNYSRVVRTDTPLNRVDLEKLLRGILESYAHLQSPHAEILVEGPFPDVLANEATLTQCISNLLGNAVKFVAPGLTPRVRVWAETRNRRVRLSFQDNGIGIPREHQEKIFEIFQRLHSGYEGTGIGLAIVKKGVERMGGTMGLESEPGKGSTFWLELNAAKAKDE
jgi:two-component system CheB/CheR fusion protein